jgi:uncharacterized coiled-coil protein SlyX
VHLCGGDYTDRDSILFYERLGAGRPFDDPAIGQSGACRWVNGGSTVFRIQSLRQYPYDPALHSYYEDFEWCYRLNQVGVGRFYRSVESLFLHHHVPKVPDATSTPYEFKLKAMPYIQSIAQFFQTHGLIIQNLFDFVPELVAADHKLMVGPAKVLLQWINTYGGQWVLKQWQLGQLAPLFTGQVSSYQEWLDWLQLALPFDQYQHYKMIQDLANQLEKHHCTLESLLTQLGKRQRVAEALSAQLAQRRQVVQTLEAQVQTMKTELTTRQQEFAETKARLIESECMVQLISAQLADTTRRLHSIYHSRYWRMMSLYWRAQGLAGRIGRRAARPKTD